MKHWFVAFRTLIGERPIPDRRGSPCVFLSWPFAAVFLTLPIGDSFTAAAAPPQARTMALTYDVYAGGLHAFTFDLDMILEPNGYRMAAAGETKGLTGFLYKWNVRLNAEGGSTQQDKSVGSERLQPRRYVTVNSGRQEPKTMQLAFDRGGSYSVKRDPPEPPDEGEEGELPASLPADIADPLTAGLIATQALAETGRCEQTIPVFDGKRRYDLRFHDMGRGQVPKSRYSVYDGPAMMCSFTMQRISGFKQKRRYASQWDEDKDERPTLWVARLREDLPPVPVRFTGAIALGSIVIHLTKFEPGTEIASTDPR